MLFDLPTRPLTSFLGVALALPTLLVQGCTSDDTSGAAAGELCAPSSVEWPDDQEPLWNNVPVFQVNREAPRAAFTTYDSVDAFDSESPLVMSLDGDWRFEFAESAGQETAGFEAPDFDDSEWVTIPVPSNVELLGYGEAIYFNIQYPWEQEMGIDFPNIPTEGNGVSSYRRTFTVPASWDGRSVFVHFAGVDSAFYVWLNGQRVGYSEGSRTPAEFNLTPFLREGENILAVRVLRWSDGTWVEKQDMWNMSGIFRSVHLWAAQDSHIRDLSIEMLTQGNVGDAARGTVAVTASVRQLLDAAATRRVHIEVSDPTGTVVGQASTDAEISGCGEQAVAVTLDTDVVPWTAEDPQLFEVTVTLRDTEDNIIEAIRRKAGFRTVTIDDGVLRVNGERIVFRGVNRHEHDPDRGHVQIDEDMVNDLRLMKQNGFNAVRAAHYPHLPRLYEVADEYGLYVMDEANIESHGLAAFYAIFLADLPEWAPVLFDRIERMYERDKNFPSIVVWSMGNEAGGGQTFDDISDFLHERDPTRPVSYEGAAFGAPVEVGDHSDLQSGFYYTPTLVEDYLNSSQPRPLVLIEYAHAMGNSSGNLDVFWDIFNSAPQAQGGFIWDWKDQGLRLDIPGGGGTFFGYGGDIGPASDTGGLLGNNFCMNGLLGSDSTPHPGLAVVKSAMQSVIVEPVDVASGVVRITNRYDHIDMSDRLATRWEVTIDGAVVESGTLDTPSLQPGASEEVTVPFTPPTVAAGAEPRLRLLFDLADDQLWADAGHQLAFADFAIPGAPAAPAIDASGASALSTTVTASTVTVTGDGFSLEFDQSNGALTSWLVDAQELITEPLRPDFWRAPTDNDIGNGLDSRASDWRTFGGLLETAGGALGVDMSAADEHVITASLSVTGLDATVDLTYRVFATGEVGVAMTLTRGSLPELPRVGIGGALRGALGQVQWYGPGPEPTYSDRKQLLVGAYEGAVAEQLVPYARGQESGNKADVRYAAITERSGVGLLVVGAPLLSVSVLPASTGAIEAAAHPHEIEMDGNTHVHFDLVQRGVAGDNSWSLPPQPEFILDAPSYDYEFWMQPLGAGDDPAVVRRKSLP